MKTTYLLQDYKKEDDGDHPEVRPKTILQGYQELPEETLAIKSLSLSPTRQ
jgi:hypothetical protein